jgi:hypothetical protein
LNGSRYYYPPNPYDNLDSTFGSEIAELIRDIERLEPRDGVQSLFDWKHPPPTAQLRKLLIGKREQVRQEAHARGWDVDLPATCELQDLLRKLEAISTEHGVVAVWVPAIVRSSLPKGEGVDAEILRTADALGLDIKAATPLPGGARWLFRKRPG